MPDHANQCALCGGPIEQALRGRQRLYCSQRCKQAAYRNRNMPPLRFPPFPTNHNSTSLRLNQAIALANALGCEPDTLASTLLDFIAQDPTPLASLTTLLEAIAHPPHAHQAPDTSWKDGPPIVNDSHNQGGQRGDSPVNRPPILSPEPVQQPDLPLLNTPLEPDQNVLGGEAECVVSTTHNQERVQTEYKLSTNRHQTGTKIERDLVNQTSPHPGSEATPSAARRR